MTNLLADYLPLAIFLGVSFVIAAALLIAPFIVAYSNPDPEKLWKFSEHVRQRLLETPAEGERQALRWLADDATVATISILWAVFGQKYEEIRGLVTHVLPSRLAELDKNQAMVVHCKSGMRSAKVIAFLRQQGFTRLRNLKGGILAWAERVDPSMPKY